MDTTLLSTFSDSLGFETACNLPTTARRGIQNEGGAVIKQTIVAALHEQGRAVLANEALTNIGTLSAMETHLCQIAPCGAGRYRAIVDAYALGAAQKLARW